jgi:peptide/nickel transport system permease protein
MAASRPSPPARMAGTIRRRDTLGEAVRTLRANRLTAAGFFLVLVTVVLAAAVEVVPLVSKALIGRALSLLPYDPNALSPALLQGPSWQHWFGTDNLGRDVFSRVLAALPLDLFIGFAIVGAALIIGGGLGLVSGFWDSGRFSRPLAGFILRVTDVFLAFPTLVLAFALAAILGRNLTATLAALIITWWPYYVRLVRGEVLTIKHQGYIPAARIAGASESRILLRHVVRNLLEPLTVYATLDVGTVLVTFSTISYFGISLPATTPEWGSMVFEYQGYLPQYLYLVLAPGLAIFVTVLGFSLLGDGLRDVLDPRTRRAFARERVAVPAPIPVERSDEPGT